MGKEVVIKSKHSCFEFNNWFSSDPHQCQTKIATCSNKFQNIFIVKKDLVLS